MTGKAPTAEAARYLGEVASILPGIRARAATVEGLGRIPEETVRELDDIGVFRALQPRQWDGLELDPGTFFESVVQIASACGATGWIAGVVAVHPWELGCFRSRLQRDVWGENTRTRLSSSYAPTGRVQAVEGGFQLSGQWRFSSGVTLSDWAILGGVPEGEKEGDLSAFIVPRSQFTWTRTAGRSPGSRDREQDDQRGRGFVPEHRRHRVSDVNRRPSRGLGSERADRFTTCPGCPGFSPMPLPHRRLAPPPGIGGFIEQSRTRVGAYGGPPVSQPGHPVPIGECAGGSRERSAPDARDMGRVSRTGVFGHTHHPGGIAGSQPLRRFSRDLQVPLCRDRSVRSGWRQRHAPFQPDPALLAGLAGDAKPPDGWPRGERRTVRAFGAQPSRVKGPRDRARA